MARNDADDVRLASFGWFEPSAVFYGGREVSRFVQLDEAVAFLRTPRPGYLFATEAAWNDLVSPAVGPQCRLLARRYDLLKNTVVVVVTNRPTEATGVANAASSQCHGPAATRPRRHLMNVQCL